MSAVEQFYFTFGVSHRLAKNYVVILAPTWEEARDQMIDWFGTDWAFQYDHLGWHRDGVSQAERYSLTRLLDERTDAVLAEVERPSDYEAVTAAMDDLYPDEDE